MVKFEDYRIEVKEALHDAAYAALEECGAELESQVKRNTRVRTGQTKGSWTHVLDEGNLQVQVGSPLENAIWEEFGTGEYALNGDGRKGGWYYVDEFGVGHFTHGKKPTRALWNAFNSMKTVINTIIESKLKGLK